MVTPAIKVFTSELFGLFRNLKYRETSFIKKARQKENFRLKISGLPRLIKFNIATPQTTRFGCFCFLNYRQQLFLFFLPQNARRKQFQFFYLISPKTTDEKKFDFSTKTKIKG